MLYAGMPNTADDMPNIADDSDYSYHTFFSQV